MLKPVNRHARAQAAREFGDVHAARDPETGEVFTVVELVDHCNALEEQVDTRASLCPRG